MANIYCENDFVSLGFSLTLVSMFDMSRAGYRIRLVPPCSTFRSIFATDSDD